MAMGDRLGRYLLAFATAVAVTSADTATAMAAALENVWRGAMLSTVLWFWQRWGSRGNARHDRTQRDLRLSAPGSRCLSGYA
jgi:hypothetical protein